MEKPKILAEYILPSGNSIIYSKTESFPPGTGTVEIARIASNDLSLLRKESRNPDQSVNVLEMGVGPGTFLVELLAQMNEPKNVNLSQCSVRNPTVRNKIWTCSTFHK